MADFMLGTFYVSEDEIIVELKQIPGLNPALYCIALVVMGKQIAESFKISEDIVWGIVDSEREKPIDMEKLNT